MKAKRTLPYVALAAFLSLVGCSTGQRLAQNGGEVDDLYGSSSDGAVYVAKQQRESRQLSEEPARRKSNNPDYFESEDEQKMAWGDEYYSDLSTRKISRGLSADPGWNTSNYNDGFVDGFNSANYAAMNNSWRWNRWGWNSASLWSGIGFGIGVSPWGWGNSWGMNRWGGMGMGSFYDPFWGSSFAYGGNPFYSPWGGGWGGGYGFYDSFYNPYGYGGYYGGGNGWYNRGVAIVNNNGNIGAARNRMVGARGTDRRDRYNDNFVNSPRSGNTNSGGRRASGYDSPSYSSNRDRSGTSASGRANNSGSYYYANPNNAGGRTSGGSYNNSGSTDTYYSRPRNTESRGNSRGTYTAAPRSNDGSNYRYSAPQQQSQSYSRPSYESRGSSNSNSQPSYSPSRTQSQPSYSAPTPSYSGGSRGGGGSSSGGGGGYSGGSSRGPR
ncbi:pilus assembly protein [Tellurirhabdus bombi]|uniref:hypothetical protein n=1 Tax=Tellurirhabdus bombi TaxID=2907205 RepID=UPI001F390B63|nr:hypothetical protein [Tellurirhabdus bombi]